MSAGGALQASVAQALGGVAQLGGIFDGPPPRAPFPYAVIDAGSESDWSNKSGAGREVMLAITLWDEHPARLHDLADECEARVAALRSVAGWALVTLRQQRRRTVRDVAGPWATVLDFKARLLQAG